MAAISRVFVLLPSFLRHLKGLCKPYQAVVREGALLVVQIKIFGEQCCCIEERWDVL